MLVVQPPRKYGLAINRWTVRDLSRFVADRYGYRISRTSTTLFAKRRRKRWTIDWRFTAKDAAKWVKAFRTED